MIAKELIEGEDWADYYLGRNEVEDFNILIAASNGKEAEKIAESYRKDSDMRGVFKVNPLSDFNAHVDCDYIVN